MCKPCTQHEYLICRVLASLGETVRYSTRSLYSIYTLFCRDSFSQCTGECYSGGKSDTSQLAAFFFPIFEITLKGNRKRNRELSPHPDMVIRSALTLDLIYCPVLGVLVDSRGIGIGSGVCTPARSEMRLFLRTGKQDREHTPPPLCRRCPSSSRFSSACSLSASFLSGYSRFELTVQS